MTSPAPPFLLFVALVLLRDVLPAHSINHSEDLTVMGSPSPAPFPLPSASQTALLLQTPSWHLRLQTVFLWVFQS